MADRSETNRERMLRTLGELKMERSSWDTHWMELAKNVLPRAGRFTASDRNRGDRRWNAIYDSTATDCQATLQAGLRSGMANESSPWVRLQTPDKDLNRSAPVREWLSDVTDLMLRIFARSNTYRAMDNTYDELGVFGTSAKIVYDDFENIIHFDPLTAGEYAIAADFRGNVNTIYREFEVPVAALAKEFGKEKLSRAAKDLLDRGNYGAWIPIVHAIEPRENRDYFSKSAKDMPYASCYFERGVAADEDHYLREGGFRQFPALVSRWATRGRDIYGESPAMRALGDIHQLQHEQMRKAQAIDYMTKPPLQGPPSQKNREFSLMPGGYTVVDAMSAGNQVRPMWDVSLRLDYLLTDIQDIRERIRNAWYTPLFSLFANLDKSQMTATEIAARNAEKLLLLGPVVARLIHEEFSPLIELTFARMVETGILPPPPPDMHGVTLDVEFISPLALALRAVGANTADRFIMTMGQLFLMKPNVADKLDEDEWADAYADMIGLDPSMIVADDKVAFIRQARAQQMQQAQTAAMAAPAKDFATAAKTVNEAAAIS
jgi:hypothetical protein